MSDNLIKTIPPMFPYTGHKGKSIPLILEHLPLDSSHFIDVFGGSGVVSLNVAANTSMQVSYNDINDKVNKLFFHCLYTSCFESKVKCIDSAYEPTKDDYMLLREDYNKSKEGVEKYAMLYCLIARSFSNIFRHNSKGKFNAPYGERNHLRLDDLREARIALSHKGIEILETDYKNVLQNFSGDKEVVLYLDPPYSITTASYNSGWKEQDSIILRQTLNDLTLSRTKWMYHDVMYNRGKENIPLIRWIEENNYNVVISNGDFSNSSFRKTSGKTHEVLIKNY